MNLNGKMKAYAGNGHRHRNAPQNGTDANLRLFCTSAIPVQPGKILRSCNAQKCKIKPPRKVSIKTIILVTTCIFDLGRCAGVPHEVKLKLQ